MTSESLLVWKIAPSRPSSSRSFGGVDEVAVVAERDLPVLAVDQDRLGVDQLAGAGRRIAHVADRQAALQARQTPPR